MSSEIDLLRELLHEVIISEKRKKKVEKDEKDVGGRPRSKPDTGFAVWLDSIGGSEAASKLTGVSVAHLNKLARDEELPSLELAAEIQRVSSGKIPVSYWVKKV